MRRAAIEAFIGHFGAARFDTAYFQGNHASRRVSEKLGYSPNGDDTVREFLNLPTTAIAT